MSGVYGCRTTTIESLYQRSIVGLKHLVPVKVVVVVVVVCVCQRERAAFISTPVTAFPLIVSEITVFERVQHKTENDKPKIIFKNLLTLSGGNSTLSKLSVSVGKEWEVPLRQTQNFCP